MTAAPPDGRFTRMSASNAGRVLGLDVGSRTIGVAATDELGLAAHAVITLERKGTKKDVAAVQRVDYAGWLETQLAGG